MPLTLTVCEKTPGAAPPQQYPVKFEEERLTVRELIRNLVIQHAQNDTEHINSSRCSSPEEKLLNSQKTGNPSGTKSWVSKFEHAVKAFDNNQVILLLDGVQAESLEQTITLTPDSKVVFFKLIPLVGG
jgi:hypothetical protein